MTSPLPTRNRATPQPALARRAFTLVEIMTVVVIIGLLAALGIPALQRVQERSTASRLANDFRQFEAGFQRYALENGRWPSAAAAGQIPAEMTGYLPEAFTRPSPLGGNYQWSGPSHNLVLRGSHATDAFMQRVDAMVDDGDLSTGDFMKTAGVGFHLIVH